jgi:hypothetical protein
MQISVVREGALTNYGDAPTAVVDRKLPWKPSDIGIDLTNPGEMTLAAGDTYIDDTEFAATSDWVIDLGEFENNVTVNLGGKRAFFLPFEGQISFDPTTDYAKAITGRRALLVQNFQAIHLQTFALGGPTISDGINFATTVPNAKVQMQHFRIEGLRENYKDTGSAVAPIASGADAQYNHPDVIQSYGGPAVLRASNFYASSDRSFMTLASAGGPNLTEVTVKKGHYKQLKHPVLGDQQTYPFFWTQAAGEPNNWPLTFDEFYYEHGAAARTANVGMFPQSDPRWLADILAGGIIESAPPESAFWVPQTTEVGHGKSSPAYVTG